MIVQFTACKLYFFVFCTLSILSILSHCTNISFHVIWAYFVVSYTRYLFRNSCCTFLNSYFTFCARKHAVWRTRRQSRPQRDRATPTATTCCKQKRTLSVENLRRTNHHHHANPAVGILIRVIVCLTTAFNCRSLYDTIRDAILTCSLSPNVQQRLQQRKKG